MLYVNVYQRDIDRASGDTYNMRHPHMTRSLADMAADFQQANSGMRRVGVWRIKPKGKRK